MLIESRHRPNIQALVTFALSVTMCEKFAVETCTDLDVNLQNELAGVECKCTNKMATYDFLYVGNSNICPVCHRL